MKQLKGFKINGETINEQNITDLVSHLRSKNGKDYIIKSENNGDLYTVELNTTEPIKGPEEPSKEIYSFNGETKLYINSFYCGGEDADEHSINYCSHNFVELSNLTTIDINLSGMSLQYVGNIGNDWKVLPLNGVIKAGSTFLIRGAQCSVLSSPTTKLLVDKYDMEWKLNNGELIKFNDKQCKFYLCYTTEQCNAENPYTALNDTGILGYIDLVGATDGVTGSIDASESSPKTGLSTKRLFKKYYSMDNGNKATKAQAKRNNSNDWDYVELDKDNGENIPNIPVYTPQPSYENKNLFYNKTDLTVGKPSMITCSFGIQATDNGSGATRCFNWLCDNLETRFIWISQNNNSWGEPHETFYTGDGRTVYNDDETKIDGVSIYDRLIKEYTNNRTLIVNKFIISGLSAGDWYYVAGKKNADGTPDMEHCTNVRKFTVRSNEDIEENGFSFVQTSDQQGFNWDEYQLWNGVCKLIEIEDTQKNINFMINTGDMTQDGNRLGEWLDYFNGKNDYLNNMEEMATIGNNDLSENLLYKVTIADDNNKLWPENITLFYTFESDKNNPPIFTVNSKKYYIPSLYSFNYGFTHFMCVNSEIKDITEQNKEGFNFGDGNYGNFYPLIKEWCENDIEQNSNDWNIAYCHEMPFTILTTGVTNNPTGNDRGGSSLNVNLKYAKQKYWFSEFCQTHNIPLVIGGHKHTQATSWPLLENVSGEGDSRVVDSLHPIIVLENVSDYDENATTLVTVGNYKYPDTWVENGVIKTLYENKAKLCSFELLSNISANVNPVIYAMSQASAYKHTSNKELPSKDTPWLKHCHGIADNDKDANPTQRYPFYTIWNVTTDNIKGNVRALFGGFNDSGKFAINVEGEYLKKWKCANTNNDKGHKGLIDSTHTHDIFSINAIDTNVDPLDTTTIIEIIK